jgi:hypothetical protein
MSVMTQRLLTAAESVTVLGPATNKEQFGKWTDRGFIAPATRDGLYRFDLIDVIRCAILLDLQHTLGPTNGLAAEVARALTPEAITKLFHSDMPEIYVDTDNGRVVFAPDPEIFVEFRDRLSRLR